MTCMFEEWILDICRQRININEPKTLHISKWSGQNNNCFDSPDSAFGSSGFCIEEEEASLS